MMRSRCASPQRCMKKCLPMPRSYNALHPVGMAAQGKGEDNMKTEITWRTKLARNATYQRVSCHHM